MFKSTTVLNARKPPQFKFSGSSIRSSVASCVQSIKESEQEENSNSSDSVSADSSERVDTPKITIAKPDGKSNMISVGPLRLDLKNNSSPVSQTEGTEGSSSVRE